MSTGLVVESQAAAVQAAFVQQAFTLAAIALLLYETCHTADLELEYLWGSGRARMILLLVTIRHFELANLVLNSISLAFLSPEICNNFGLITEILVVIPYFSWAVFLGWRAYALSSNAFIAFLVLICSGSFASPSLLVIIGSTRSYVPTTPPACNLNYKWAGGPQTATLLLYISRPAAIFAEVVVLALTCRATYREWRSSKTTRPHSLSGVLYENGLVCFVVGTAIHVIAAAISLSSSTKINIFSAETATILRDALITVFLSRFILELARVGAVTSDADQGARGTLGILTTEWSEYVSDVPSQWTIDDEYNGRGFDKDLESFEPPKHYDA